MPLQARATLRMSSLRRRLRATSDSICSILRVPPIEINVDSGWATPLATVVAALAGTLIGGLISLRVSREARDEGRRTELVAALGAYLHAADLLATALANTPPPRSLGKLERAVVRLIGERPIYVASSIVERFAFGQRNDQLIDRFYESSNRLRLLAPIEVLGWTNDVDRLFSEWSEKTGSTLQPQWSELRESLQLIFQRTADFGQGRPYRADGDRIGSPATALSLSTVYLGLLFATALAFATWKADDRWQAGGVSALAISALLLSPPLLHPLFPSPLPKRARRLAGALRIAGAISLVGAAGLIAVAIVDYVSDWQELRLAEAGEVLSYTASVMLVIYAVVGSLAVAAGAPIRRTAIGSRLERSLASRVRPRHTLILGGLLFFAGVALEVRASF